MLVKVLKPPAETKRPTSLVVVSLENKLVPYIFRKPKAGGANLITEPLENAEDLHLEAGGQTIIVTLGFKAVVPENACGIAYLGGLYRDAYLLDGYDAPRYSLQCSSCYRENKSYGEVSQIFETIPPIRRSFHVAIDVPKPGSPFPEAGHSFAVVKVDGVLANWVLHVEDAVNPFVYRTSDQKGPAQTIPAITGGTIGTEQPKAQLLVRGDDCYFLVSTRVYNPTIHDWVKYGSVLMPNLKGTAVLTLDREETICLAQPGEEIEGLPVHAVAANCVFYPDMAATLNGAGVPMGWEEVMPLVQTTPALPRLNMDVATAVPLCASDDFAFIGRCAERGWVSFYGLNSCMDDVGSSIELLERVAKKKKNETCVVYLALTESAPGGIKDYIGETPSGMKFFEESGGDKKRVRFEEEEEG
jgi:hypothetical protein